MEEELKVGPYILWRKIDDDGWAEAWEGRHEFLDRRVVVKSLLPGLSHESDFEELLRGARIQMRLQHPNIVPIIDFLTSEGRVYVISSYIEGETLEALLKRRRDPLTVEEIYSISRDVLSALDSAHSQGIVHRDVNPANILIDKSGRALLTDFSLVRLAPKDRELTSAGASMGTPSYISPEGILGSRPVDARSDIYSFGCVLYELLAGHPSFGREGDTQYSIFSRHVREVPPPLDFVNAQIPNAVKGVVLKCLQKDPDNRFQDSREVIAAIESALSVVSPSARVTQTIGSPPQASAFAPPARRQTEFDSPAPAQSVPALTGRSGFPSLASRIPVIGKSDPKLSPTELSAPDSTLVRVFYATDRMQMPSLPGNAKYGRLRSLGGNLHFGKCEISIPRKHKTGRLETPSILRLEFRPNPKKHIVLTKTSSLQEREFIEALSWSVSQSTQKDAFIFIHGYNVSFEDAARRTGQIAYDLDFIGAPIFYSWPSNGKIAAYLKDETNIAWSAPHFQSFLDMVACRSGAERVHIIAHSMGNRAVCDAIKALSFDLTNRIKFNHLLLAAPDIDADTFQELAALLQRLCGRITIYESSRDKAIQASKKVHGNPRVGEPIFVLPGIDTIDATEVDTDFLGHSYFSDNWPLLADMHSILFDDKPPSSRFGLMPLDHKDGRYYAFRR